MQSIVRTLLITLILLHSPASRATDEFSDPQVLGRWITHYYAQPQSHRLGEALRAAHAHGFMANGRKAPPFIGFIAGVLSGNPSVARPLVEQLASLPETDRPVLILGIWYSTHPEARLLLSELAASMPEHKGMIEHLLANHRPGLLELPLEQGPWVLDALWGYFMATGDAAPVGRIIAALPWVNVRGDTSRLLLGGAARWSLTSNAIQHPSVMAICRQEIARQPEDVAAVLREVIADAEKDEHEASTE